MDWLDGAYHDLPSVTTPFAALVYNEAGQIAVRIDKEVAQAAVREVSPGIIASQPDYFYTGFKQVPPSHEALTYVTVNMVQRIKLLRMTLHIDRNSDIPISGLSTTLSGVVGSIDMRSGASVDKESKSLLPIFEPSAVTKATLSRESYVSESRLFGVRKADSQQLAIRLTLQNGMTFLFNSDLTQALKEFNEVETSLDILATLKLEDTGLDTITCSITDWNVVENGDFEIH